MKYPLLTAAAFFCTGMASARLPVPQVQTDPLQAEAEEYGIPLPPTADEINALSAEERERQATAIKRVHLLQQLQFIQDSYCMTEGNRMASVFLAIKLKAPEVYIQLLQLEAAGELSTGQHRVLRKAYARLFERYGVDTLGIRFFAESELAPLEVLADLSAELPMASLFNLVNAEALTAAQAVQDMQEVALVFNELTSLYASVTNAEQAAAAVPQVCELVSRFGKVYPGLALAPEKIRRQFAPAYTLKIQPLLPALAEQRKRLREADFYGNTHLKVLDYFFD